MESRRVGRPATGRSTKVVRIPVEMDERELLKIYKVLRKYMGIAGKSATSPRTKLLREMFKEIGWEVGEELKN